MELDITDFVANADPKAYCGSVAELGENAGPMTWNAAHRDSEKFPLLQTDQQRETFRAWLKSTGGWTQEEIGEWNNVELNALCIQFMSGDILDAQDENSGPLAHWDAADWERYYARANRGEIAGTLTRSSDGRIYYYVGN
jgi:hypothetical protein